MRPLPRMPQVLGKTIYPGGHPAPFLHPTWKPHFVTRIRKAKIKYYTPTVSANDPVQEDFNPLTEEDIQLLIEYLVYYINAPHWLKKKANEGVVRPIINKADQLKTVNDIEEFLNLCMSIGLDPL